MSKIKFESNDYLYIKNPVYINRLIAWSGITEVRKYVPLWLTEGFYQNKAYASTKTEAVFSYSAIEFNIIPSMKFIFGFIKEME